MSSAIFLLHKIVLRCSARCFQNCVTNVITVLWMIIRLRNHFQFFTLFHVFGKQNQPMKRPSQWKGLCHIPLITEITGPMEYSNSGRNRLMKVPNVKSVVYSKVIVSIWFSHWINLWSKWKPCLWTIGFVAPAGFWPRGQNPRRHYSLPRVYV